MKFNMGLQRVHWEKQKKLVEVWFYYHLCWPVTSDQCPAKALIRLKAAFQFISLNILREIDTNAGLQKDRPDRREESGKQKTKRNERYLGSNKGWRRPIASKMVDELMTWDFVLKWFPGTTLWDRGSPDAWYQNSENLPQNMWSAFWVRKHRPWFISQTEREHFMQWWRRSLPANIWKDVLVYIAAYYIIFFSVKWVSIFSHYLYLR